MSGFTWSVAIVSVESAPQDGALTRRLYGAGTMIRTRDLLITNQLLYQLSYAGEGGELFAILPGHTRPSVALSCLRAGRRIAQHDLVLAVLFDDRTRAPAWR